MGYFDEAIENKENEEVLEHHGIRGQKWGIRRFQNKDGSLTSKGKSRYGETSDLYNAKKEARSAARQSRRERAKVDRDLDRAITEPTSRVKEIRDYQYKTIAKKSAELLKAEKRSKEKQQAYKDAKKAYNDAYEKNRKEVKEKATFGEKLIYNDATRNRAAKLMTKYKDMDYEKATAQAKKEAARNTAIVLGAYGTYALGKAVATKIK